MGFRIEKGFTSPPPATPEVPADVTQQLVNQQQQIDELTETINTMLGVTT